MKYLITGGLGFIGSHICIELFKYYNNTALINNLSIVIVDNLSNSSLNVLENIKQIIKQQNKLDVHLSNNQLLPLQFYNCDILCKDEMNDIFEEHKPDVVYHLAALKSVSESNANPDLYNRNNEEGTKIVLDLMKKHKCHNFIFSSSATVYGENVYPISEESSIGEGLTNVYAHNKYNIETHITDISTTPAFQDFSFMVLRYFNPIGAHPSGLLGDNPKNIPNNLFPYILKVSIGELKELVIFGNDYDTEDGTCKRDYIHISDLAKGHINILKHVNNTGIHIYNLGTGKSTSVLELVNCFNECVDIYNQINKSNENSNVNKINYIIGERRDGDLHNVYALVDKAKKELDWYAECDIRDMCMDGINFIDNQVKGITF
jgi:UDP-glucose 4-epimerase